MGILELHQRPVVVGVDGSPESLCALQWAYRESARTGAPLHVLTAWPSHSRGAEPIGTQAQALAVARKAIESALPVDHSHVYAPALPGPGEAADVLLREASTAALLAIGPRSHHSVTEHLLGSVTEHLLSAALCPVAVIHSEAEQAPASHRIVVGVDGSAASLEALHLAASRAAATDSKVDALLAWEWQAEYGVYPYGPDRRQQHARAEAALARAVLTLPERLRSVVRTEAINGHAAEVLIAASDTADALIVGNSRSGHVASHLLGSVSRKVAMRARVPVIVTHAPSAQRRGARAATS